MASFAAAHARAVHPVELHWYIFYTTPCRAGLQTAHLWSPNCRQCVEGQFYNEFFEEMPSIQFMDYVVDGA